MSKAIKVPEEKLKEVKETLTNLALELLEQGDDISKLVDTKVEFGYIYMRGNEYESLFKIITDKTTVYFAVQQGKLMRLQDTFDDEMFLRTVAQMESLHGEWK